MDDLPEDVMLEIEAKIAAYRQRRIAVARQKLSSRAWNNRFTERNREIATRFADGETYAQLAKHYSLSNTSIMHICERVICQGGGGLVSGVAEVRAALKKLLA